MTKKDKKLHKLSKDIEMVVEENTPKRKRKRTSDLDTPLETSELCNEQTVIAEPSPKKRKKKKSKSKLDEKDITLETIESPPQKKREREKKPAEESPLCAVETGILKKAKVNLRLDVVDDSLIEEPSPKKSKKKKSKSKSKDATLESEQSPPQKKSKREKKKKSAEESLGVVDTDILKQAKVNLGLDIVDDAVSEQKENVEDEHNSKQKKKKKKDKKSEVVSSSEPNEKNRNERALEYLRLWKVNKKKWKFNKMMQVQLLHIMYDKSLITDEDFAALLLYLDGLKGKGRERTMVDAKKIFDKEETEGVADTDREDRARQIFQMLA